MRELIAIEKTYTKHATGLDRDLHQARLSNDSAAIEWVEKQQLINDSAYFVIVWGQLEAKINEMCHAAVRKRRDSPNWQRRRAWDAHDPDKMRAKFEDRAALVLDRSNVDSDAYRRTIRYYGVRNQVAHGTSLATGIDLSSIIGDVYQIISELRS